MNTALTAWIADDLDELVNQTHELWESLRNQRLFITGGTGFFGCWFLETFIWANHQLKLNAHAVVLTRNPSSFIKKYPHFNQSPSVSFHTGDVRSFDFPEGNFAYIIHAAAETSGVNQSFNSLNNWDISVNGTKRVFDFAVQSNVKQILLVSSGAVYGKQPSELLCVPETYYVNSNVSSDYSSYAIGKQTAEYLAHLYAHNYGLAIKIARCFAFTGPYLPLNAAFAIGNFIRDGLNGGPIVIQGDGTPYRSYLYAADLMLWLWTIFFKGECLRPYNVGSDDYYSVNEIAQMVSSVLPARPAVHRLRTPDEDCLPERYVPEIKRVHDEFGLVPRRGTLEAIQATVNWCLNTRHTLCA